jgi:hypothetical protein
LALLPAALITFGGMAMADEVSGTPIADTVAGGLKAYWGKRKIQGGFQRRPAEDRGRPPPQPPMTDEERADREWSTPR